MYDEIPVPHPIHLMKAFRILSQVGYGQKEEVL